MVVKGVGASKGDRKLDREIRSVPSKAEVVELENVDAGNADADNIRPDAAP